MGKSDLQKIAGTFSGKDILSLDQFDAKDISLLFKQTDKLKKLAQKSKPSDILAGTVTTLLFFEPSSRTFSSFNAAIKRLGGSTIDIQNPQQVSSVAKGETLEDTIRTFESYSNAIVMRHPQKGAARQAADAAEKIPVINAGDGIGEHPTQALLDLYTIYEQVGRLENLTILMAGDILNGRTVHSLIRALSLYKNNTVYLLSPEKLKLAKEDKDNFTKRGITLHEIISEKDIPANAQVWYWTRVQKERFENIAEYEKIKHAFIVTPELMKKYAAKDMVLMHPLPRVGEIEVSVDADPRAMYLRHQMRNGMYVRMAIMALVLNRI